MCGRLNILANMLNNQVSDELRVRYNTTDNLISALAKSLPHFAKILAPALIPTACSNMK